MISTGGVFELAQFCARFSISVPRVAVVGKWLGVADGKCTSDLRAKWRDERFGCSCIEAGFFKKVEDAR